jgi:hypothetical protein
LVTDGQFMKWFTFCSFRFLHLNGCKFNCFEILSPCALPVYSGYVDIGVNIVQKKVIETREQLRRIAQRLGIVLKSSERDMQVSLQASY